MSLAWLVAVVLALPILNECVVLLCAAILRACMSSDAITLHQCPGQDLTFHPSGVKLQLMPFILLFFSIYSFAFKAFVCYVQ